MDILQKHTNQYFGAMQHIRRSGKVIYAARPAANSDLGLWHDGRKVQRTFNYSRERKNSLPLLDRILYR